MKIVQMHNSTSSQMMGYLLVTESGKLVAIDGGTRGDAAEFQRLVREYGKGCNEELELWFLTHPHKDHVGVFCEMVEAGRKKAKNKTLDTENAGEEKKYDVGEESREPENAAEKGSQKPENTIGKELEPVKAKVVLYSPAPKDFIHWDGPEGQKDMDAFAKGLSRTIYPMHILELGEHFEVDNVSFDILHVAEPEIPVDIINNLSVVIRVKEKLSSGECFTMLFLGDLGERAGRVLLASYDKETLKADAVQMAHHGQNGVDFPVYETIAPKWAFWSTPDWLWINTPPGWKEGTGPWKTLEVREWMEKLQTIPVTSMRAHAVFDTEEAVCVLRTVKKESN